MSKIALGYIASHPFWNNTYLPQRVQNNLVNSYCINNDFSLVWSIPEVSIGYRSFPALRNFLKSNKTKIDSVIFISYQMNHPLSIIDSINRILDQSIEVCFVIENCRINNIYELERLQTEIKLSYLLTNQRSSPLLDFRS